MTDNRLKSSTKVSYGLDRLRLHCEELNAMGWVRESGRPYMITSRVDANGIVTHYIDRKGQS